MDVPRRLAFGERVATVRMGPRLAWNQIKRDDKRDGEGSDIARYRHYKLRQG